MPTGATHGEAQGRALRITEDPRLPKTQGPAAENPAHRSQARRSQGQSPSTTEDPRLPGEQRHFRERGGKGIGRGLRMAATES